MAKTKDRANGTAIRMLPSVRSLHFASWDKEGDFLHSSRLKRLLDVCKNVLNVFYSHAKADEVRGDTGLTKLLV